MAYYVFLNERSLVSAQTVTWVRESIRESIKEERPDWRVTMRRLLYGIVGMKDSPAEPRSSFRPRGASDATRTRSGAMELNRVPALLEPARSNGPGSLWLLWPSGRWAGLSGIS